MIAMVETETIRAGKTCLERRYYLSSAKLSAKQFAHAVRTHWHVENRLHWVLDVVFHDDLMRLRTDNGPANMATVRHMSLNIIRSISDKASLKVRKKPSLGTTNTSSLPSQTPLISFQAIRLKARGIAFEDWRTG